MHSTNAVATELIWQLLRQGMPGVVGKGPFPALQKLGTIERTLLAGFAGIKAKTLPEAINGVAALALGLEKVSADTLREQLIKIGVSRADMQASSPETTNGSFAHRVLVVAETLSTPPFQGRVAIAQVYDAYGKVHADAGSLQSFKERLVQSAKAREIDLGSLDLPERMSKDLRQRSETRWGSDEVHFVIIDWR
jgi:hypothetical protein